jgi:isopentenyl-diphosphate delta-isomerase
MEQVILVDEFDNDLGVMEKILAHKNALLHRAFSVFVFNEKGQLLLQRRALTKYHSPGLWTNTCCSHPRPNEITYDAANRRLKEEMGFECELAYQFNFVYKAELDQGLTEHEFDHVFFGIYNGAVNPNAEEVLDYKFVDVQEVLLDMDANPEKYTVWFKIIFNKVNQIKNGNTN